MCNPRTSTDRRSGHDGHGVQKGELIRIAFYITEMILKTEVDPGVTTGRTKDKRGI